MSGKYFLVDTTKCIACRGCQVACKQWNKLPGVRTHQWGSPQNPQDLDASTYRLVRFQEYQMHAATVWNPLVRMRRTAMLPMRSSLTRTGRLCVLKRQKNWVKMRKVLLTHAHTTSPAWTRRLVPWPNVICAICVSGKGGSPVV